MKKLIIAGAALFTVATGTVYGVVNSPEEIGADEKPPIVLQVENHEERIGDLEVKTDKTQTQVNQNTADIGALQGNTNTEPAPAVEPVITPTKKSSSSAPTTSPEPEPVDPHTITAVVDTPGAHGHVCKYTLENGKVTSVNTGNQLACYEVGTVLPQWLWPK